MRSAFVIWILSILVAPFFAMMVVAEYKVAGFIAAMAFPIAIASAFVVASHHGDLREAKNEPDMMIGIIVWLGLTILGVAVSHAVIMGACSLMKF